MIFVLGLLDCDGSRICGRFEEIVHQTIPVNDGWKGGRREGSTRQYRVAGGNYLIKLNRCGAVYETVATVIRAYISLGMGISCTRTS